MKTEYDVSTKDKEISYIGLVDAVLDLLGFNKANNGTRLLRKFIIYIYLKNPFEIDVKKEINEFIGDNKIEKTYSNIYKRFQYAIYNCDIDKMKSNFYIAFHVKYEYYYLSVKRMIIFILNVLEKKRVWKAILFE